MKKRLLSSVLAICMIFNMSGTMAFADDTSAAATPTQTAVDSGAVPPAAEDENTCTCTPVDSGEQKIHQKGCPLYSASGEQNGADNAALQKLIDEIDALPEAAHLTDENSVEAALALESIWAAYDALSEADREALFADAFRMNKLRELAAALAEVEPTPIDRFCAKIDALPNADEITDENREAATTDFNEVWAAYEALFADKTITDLDAQLGAERMAKLIALRGLLLNMVNLAAPTQITIDTASNAGVIAIEDGTAEGTLKVTTPDNKVQDNVPAATVIEIIGDKQSRSRITVDTSADRTVLLMLSGIYFSVDDTDVHDMELKNSSNVVITLKNGTINKLENRGGCGIKTAENTKLTIQCEQAKGHVCDESCGTLNVTVGLRFTECIAIGNNNGNCGAIEILGGKITAATSSFGQIGVKSRYDCTDGGTVTVYGGDITCIDQESDRLSSAIGGGAVAVTLDGGKITARGFLGHGNGTLAINDGEILDCASLRGKTITIANGYSTPIHVCQNNNNNLSALRGMFYVGDGNTDKLTSYIGCNITKDFTLPAGTTLTINEGAVVTVAAGAEFIVPADASIILEGKIVVNGTLNNKGNVTLETTGALEKGDSGIIIGVDKAKELAVAAARGDVGGTTKITAAAPEAGSKQYYKVSDSIVPTPNGGASLPQDVAELPADTVVYAIPKQYVAVYEVKADNKVSKFGYIELAEDMVNTTKADTLSLKVDKATESQENSGKIKVAVSGLSGGGLYYLFSDTEKTHPIQNSSKPAELLPLAEGLIAAQGNKHLCVYEIDANDRVVSFAQKLVAHADVYYYTMGVTVDTANNTIYANGTPIYIEVLSKNDIDVRYDEGGKHVGDNTKSLWLVDPNNGPLDKTHTNNYNLYNYKFVAGTAESEEAAPTASISIEEPLPHGCTIEKGNAAAATLLVEENSDDNAYADFENFFAHYENGSYFVRGSIDYSSAKPITNTIGYIQMVASIGLPQGCQLTLADGASLTIPSITAVRRDQIILGDGAQIIGCEPHYIAGGEVKLLDSEGNPITENTAAWDETIQVQVTISPTQARQMRLSARAVGNPEESAVESEGNLPTVDTGVMDVILPAYYKDSDGSDKRELYRYNTAQFTDQKDGSLQAVVCVPASAIVPYDAENDDKYESLFLDTSVTIQVRWNYKDKEQAAVEVPFIVTRARQDAFNVKKCSPVVYGSTAQLETEGGSGDGNNIVWEVTEGSDVIDIDSATGVVTAKKVGTATVTATKEGDSRYLAAAATATIKVTGATPTLAWKTEDEAQTVEYTGSEAVITAATATGVTGGTTPSGVIFYAHKAKASGAKALFALFEGYTDSLPTAVGTYTVKAKIEANGNYTAADSTNELTLTITKVTPTAPAAPTVTNDYTNLTDTEITLTPPTVAEGFTLEYSKDEGKSWQASPTFEGLTADTAYTFSVRIKANSNNDASVASETLTQKTRPAAPDAGGVSIDYDAETVDFADTTLEISPNKDSWDITIANGGSITECIDGSNTLYLRTKASGDSLSGMITTLEGLKRPNTALTIDFESETVTIPSTLKYSIEPTTGTTNPTYDTVGSGVPMDIKAHIAAFGAPTNTIYYYQPANAESKTFRSEDKTILIPTRRPTPKIEKDSGRFDAITLLHDGDSFRIKQGDTAWSAWQENASFTGLTPNTEYTFEAKYKALVGVQFASAAGEAKLSTPTIDFTDIDIAESMTVHLREDVSFTYNGKPQTPKPEELIVTVKASDGSDYTVSSDNYTVSATNNVYVNQGSSVILNGIEQCSGESQNPILFEILPAPLTITKMTVTAEYDGSYTGTNMVVDATFDGLQNGETLAVGVDYDYDICFDTPEVGDNKPMDGVVYLNYDSKGDNYLLTNDEGEEFIRIITGTMLKGEYNGTEITAPKLVMENTAKKSVAFDLSTLTFGEGFTGIKFKAAAIAENASGLLTGTPTVKDGKLFFDVAAKPKDTTAELEVTVESDNYKDYAVTINVSTVDKTPVDISGVVVENASYSGTPIEVDTENLKISDATLDPATLVYTYTSTDEGGYQSTTPPTNAGSYVLVVSVPNDHETFTGESAPLYFTIEKIYLSITAISHVLYTGFTSDLPAPVLFYDGFVNGETPADLDHNDFTATNPTISDNTEVAEYFIEVSGTAEDKNYEIDTEYGSITVKDMSDVEKQEPVEIDGKQFTLVSDEASSGQSGDLYAQYGEHEDFLEGYWLGEVTELNLSLLDKDNNTVENPTKPVTVKLPYSLLPAGSSPEDSFKILHLKHDGSVEIFEDDDIIKTEVGIEFTIRSFSPFAILRTAYTPPEEGGDGGDGGNGGGSGGSDSDSDSSDEYDEYEFWNEVKNSISTAENGGVVKVDAKFCDKMPIGVMTALRSKNVGLVIKWNGGDTITIPAGKAHQSETNRIYYPLSLLAELYKGIEFVENARPTELGKVNPTTGGFCYVDVTTGKTQPISGGVVEVAPPVVVAEASTNASLAVTPPESGFEKDDFAKAVEENEANGTNLAIAFAGIMLLLAGIGGVALWKKKEEN